MALCYTEINVFTFYVGRNFLVIPITLCFSCSNINEQPDYNINRMKNYNVACITPFSSIRIPSLYENLFHAVSNARVASNALDGRTFFSDSSKKIKFTDDKVLPIRPFVNLYLIYINFSY